MRKFIVIAVLAAFAAWGVNTLVDGAKSVVTSAGETRDAAIKAAEGE